MPKPKELQSFTYCHLHDADTPHLLTLIISAYDLNASEKMLIYLVKKPEDWKLLQYRG